VPAPLSYNRTAESVIVSGFPMRPLKSCFSYAIISSILLHFEVFFEDSRGYVTHLTRIPSDSPLFPNPDELFPVTQLQQSAKSLNMVKGS